MNVLEETERQESYARDQSAPLEDFSHQHAHSLAEAVETAAREIEPSSLEPVPESGAGPAFQPRALLGLISFCYARQIYGSAAIATQLRGDSQLCRLCHNELPDSGAIQQFRRANHHALRFCLASALCFLAREKIAQGLVTRFNAHQLAEEAERRIVSASFIDSAELPEPRAADQTASAPRFSVEALSE